MKFEPGKSYKTRGGEDALIYCVDAPGLTPIHGRVHGRFGADMHCWTESGMIASVTNHDFDLIAPEPGRISRVGFINIHKDGSICFYRGGEASEEKWNFSDFSRVAVPCRIEEIE
jgi:hypothetical protein